MQHHDKDYHQVCILCGGGFKTNTFEYCPACGHPTGWKKPWQKKRSQFGRFTKSKK